MTHHTPGPWESFAEGNTFTVFPTIDPSDDNSTVICSHVSEADVSLICAAPTLLNVLELFAEAYYGNDTSITRADIEEARAAIAQAKGESK